MDFWGAASTNKSPDRHVSQIERGNLFDLPLFHQAPNNTQSIMQTTLAFIYNKIIASRSQNADSSSPIFDASDAHNFNTRVTSFFHQIGISQFVFSERLNVRDRFASQTFWEEFDLVAFHILDNKDIQALEIVKRQIIDCVTENRFLDQKNIAVRLFDLLAQIEDVLATFLQHFVHKTVIVNDDGVIHLYNKYVNIVLRTNMA